MSAHRSDGKATKPMGALMVGALALCSAISEPLRYML